MGPDSQPPSNLLITGALRAPAAPGGRAGGEGRPIPQARRARGLRATLGWAPAPGLGEADWATSGDFWRPRREAKVHPPSTQLPVFLKPQLTQRLGFAIPGWAC